MVNFLYCFDSNYNDQAFSSMISILDNTSTDIKLYIIHKNEINKEFIPREIKKHENLEKLTVYKFNSNHKEFPNIENAHVSEATYYRIFFDEYLDEEIKSIVYIDADIICNKDPSKLINEFTNDLINSEYVISAKTEFKKNKNTIKDFERIKLKSTKYFNAGFLLIDINKWKRNNIKNKLLELFNIIDFELTAWDQDLLNYFIDGNYNELPNELNLNINLEKNYKKHELKKLYEETIFFHFYGKVKPWVSRGLFTKNSEIYQNNFRKISKLKYHIEHRYIRSSLYFLFKSFFTLRFIDIKYKLNFLRIFFLEAIKKKAIKD